MTAKALDAVMAVPPPTAAAAAAAGAAAPAAAADGAPAALEALRAAAAAAVSALGPFAPKHAPSAARAVDFANREAFVRYLRSAAVRRGQSAAHLEAFLQGLGAVLPAELLPLFTPQELDAMLCGNVFVNIDLLRE